METVRLKKTKVFSELLWVFDEKEKLYVLAEKWDNQGYCKHLQGYLTPTQFKVIEKVFRYDTKDRPFQKDRCDEETQKIKNTFEKAEYIIKSMCLEEVEFMELNKEDFSTWKTFREWMEKCNVQNQA